ncbi:MAG: class I SAM-dependent RNA methyltransferase [Oscillospiraceae bacterium]|nr:class I SAM-dependent RNA methyltransferase [Oscillospiraceae bacterium]
MNFTYCVPCLLGLEGPIADELRRLGLENVAAENGRVYFTGGESAAAAANINLRIGERVLIELGKFQALSFDELFERTKALPWEQLIPKDGAFPVKGYSLNSKLFSVSDCQSIIKKAIVERLKSRYGIEWFSETGPLYQVQFSIMKDQVSLCIDTTGDGLHKRGYRPAHNAAPLKETLAAAMVYLSRYRGRDDFCDPFCGSGTIPIEAALIAKNRAPGLYRDFSAMKWAGFGGDIWTDAREAARAREYAGSYNILGSDIDPKAVEMAQENARRAGVDDVVRFETADALQFKRVTERGVIVTNPPYGERIMEKQEAEALYRGFGAAYRVSENWQLYLLSSHTEFERSFGAQADKKRKLYNGMIKCDLFMYLKPGKK